MTQDVEDSHTNTKESHKISCTVMWPLAVSATQTQGQETAFQIMLIESLVPGEIGIYCYPYKLILYYT